MKFSVKMGQRYLFQIKPTDYFRLPGTLDGALLELAWRAPHVNPDYVLLSVWVHGIGCTFSKTLPWVHRNDLCHGLTIACKKS